MSTTERLATAQAWIRRVIIEQIAGPSVAEQRRKARADIVVWVAIGLIGVVNLPVYASQGMLLMPVWEVCGFIALLIVMSVFFRPYNAGAAVLAGAFAQLVTFGQVGGYLSYGVLAASPHPWADQALAHADSLLGFVWEDWFLWVKQHPQLDAILIWAYGSVPMQIMLLFCYFAFRKPRRIDEALLSAMISISVIIAVLYFYPAGIAEPQLRLADQPWHSDIIALRQHELRVVHKTIGVIVFPSFHAVLAMLLAHMARGHKLLSPLFAVNALMLMSVMSVGAHFLVDMLSGVLVAGGSIVAAGRILDRCEVSPAGGDRPS